jgi:hypothetical protein
MTVLKHDRACQDMTRACQNMTVPARRAPGECAPGGHGVNRPDEPGGFNRPGGYAARAVS